MLHVILKNLQSREQRKNFWCCFAAFALASLDVDIEMNKNEKLQN